MKRAQAEQGSNSMDRISDLPEEIRQRILYFLSQKEAVRTSVLSKSWRYLWCTRPNLDFSETFLQKFRSIRRMNFPEYSLDLLKTFLTEKNQEFLSIVDNTLHQYSDQRLSLEELHLCIRVSDSDHEYVSFLENWIPLLTTMGVKKFCLCIRLDHFSRKRVVKLPSIVFGAESLQDLHVEELELDQNSIQRIVLFNHLRILRLHQVGIEDEVFQRIISSCPLIETLDCEGCRSLTTIKVNDLHNLKYFKLSSMPKCRIEIHTPSIETMDISPGNIWLYKGTEFHNLSDLSLGNVRSSLSFKLLSSCKFPSLKRLTLMCCHGLREIKLFIDAPNINYFSYDGVFIPSISFATTANSNEWYSDVVLRYGLLDDDASSRFLELNELLKLLSQSEITLTIHHYRPNTEDIIIQEIMNLVQEINGCNNEPVVVESLKLNCDLSCYSSLLNALFCICRPRNIDEYLKGTFWRMRLIECLWKILMERESGDKDLEQVSLEIKETGQEQEWRTISTLSELPRERILSRFALKWRKTLTPQDSCVRDLEDVNMEN